MANASNSFWRWFHQLGSPKWFYQKSAKWLPWLWAVTAVLFAFGLYYSLYASPVDYQQGNSVRIMYIHVPAAVLSMVGYLAMAICAVIGMVWKMKMSFMAMRAIAPVGALFTFLCLFTGSMWGIPTWGTWWEWDARMTSELVLLFLYLGFIALHSSFSDRSKADNAAAILALVGAINIPIIYGSVKWWNTLHQGYSLGKGGISDEFKPALYLMISALYLLFTIMVIIRLRLEVMNREAKSKWLQAELTGSKAS